MTRLTTPSIGVAIPTLRAKRHLHHVLHPFLHSPLRPRVLVVDSSSDDGTAKLAKKMGAEVISISPDEFNHGITREMARRYLGTDIFVTSTQDCYAQNRHVLKLLTAPLIQKEASIAYARQIPHIGAGTLESFARVFNYPTESQNRSIADLRMQGVYTYFCSNSCAAYLNSALEEIGGFDKVLLGEDTVATARLLHSGHRIAYVAEAIVRHSHHYSLIEEFQRSFDTGLARRSYHHLIDAANGDSRRGRAYVRALTSYLLQHNPHLLPYAAIQTAIKWLGYQLGWQCHEAPTWLKAAFSSQKGYWKGEGEG